MFTLNTGCCNLLLASHLAYMTIPDFKNQCQLALVAGIGVFAHNLSGLARQMAENSLSASDIQSQYNVCTVM